MALASARVTVVAPRFSAGAMEAVPVICTAPAMAAGLVSVACQRLFRFVSLALTSTAGRLNGLQPANTSPETASTISFFRFIFSLS